MLLVGSLSFVGLGILTAVLPLMFTERGAQMTRIVEAVFLLVSGVYYPVTVLPGWLQVVAKVSPATYVLEGMRSSLLDGADVFSLLGYLGPLLLIGLLSIPVGLLVFGWAERQAKRQGWLKRSG